jgi:enoyl-CoA hydratase/carnithine racemase
MAERFNTLPPGAVRDSKQLLRRASVERVLETINAKAIIFGQRLSSPEATEAFSAFFQKRKPDFSSFS